MTTIQVEPSAALAILKQESDEKILRDRLSIAPHRVMTVVGKVEAAISFGRALGDIDAGAQIVSDFCDTVNIEVVAVTPEIFDVATKAYRRFGKGTGHPAQLNFGDCFSYAYSKRYGVPLLFKGADFARTDIESAL